MENERAIHEKSEGGRVELTVREAKSWKELGLFEELQIKESVWLKGAENRVRIVGDAQR